MDNVTIIDKNENGKHITSLSTKQLLKVIVNGETIYEKKEPFYKIVAIVGPSGCGKTTIMNRLKEIDYSRFRFHSLTFSTSRPRRDNESKKAYYFYSKEDFEDMLNHDEMIQCSKFGSWYYGLEEGELSTSQINVGIFSPHALKELRDKLGDKAYIETFYIKTSDKARMIRSLAREEEPDVSEIIRRYCSDNADFKAFEAGDISYTPLDNEKDSDLGLCIEHISNAICQMSGE